MTPPAVYVRAIALHCEGLDQEEIANQIGTTARTVSTLFKRDDFQTIKTRILNRIADRFADQLADKLKKPQSYSLHQLPYRSKLPSRQRDSQEKEEKA